MTQNIASNPQALNTPFQSMAEAWSEAVAAATSVAEEKNTSPTRALTTGAANSIAHSTR